jgi:hypothetical protein
MKKRHAIYTQSLYVPFLELPSYFPGSSTEDRRGRHQLFGVHPNDNVSQRIHDPDEASFSEMSQAFASESRITFSNVNPDYPASGQGIVEAAPSFQVSMLKPSGLSTTAPHNGGYRGLNYYRLSRVYPLSAEARLHIFYPRIVCEMLADIDRAIHEWKHM